MLEVGHIEGPLNFTEGRSHFGAWCIVSSPLTLGFDVTNPTLMKEVWPIISNTEAIAVSQSWHNHPGRLVASMPAGAHDADIQWEAWAKPQANGAMAVLLVSNSVSDVTASISFSGIGLSGTVSVRDIWERKDAGTATGSFSAKLSTHDSSFVLLTPQ